MCVLNYEGILWEGDKKAKFRIQEIFFEGKNVF